MIYFEFIDDSEIEIIPIDSSSPGWGDWNQYSINIPNLKSLAVSAVSGHPRVLGWADKVDSLNNYFVPEGKASLECVLASAFYNAMKNGAPHKKRASYYKPDYNTLNKKLRAPFSAPLPELTNWSPTPEEIAHHQITHPNSVPNISWPFRLKKIHNSVFVPPLVKQLILNITRSTLRSGDRIIFYNPHGICPFCQGELATPKHMFLLCPLIQNSPRQTTGH